MDCYVTLCYEVEVSFNLYLRHFNKSTTKSRTSKNSAWSVRRINEASKVLLSKKCKAKSFFVMMRSVDNVVVYFRDTEVGLHLPGTSR